MPDYRRNCNEEKSFKKSKGIVWKILQGQIDKSEQLIATEGNKSQKNVAAYKKTHNSFMCLNFSLG